MLNVSYAKLSALLQSNFLECGELQCLVPIYYSSLSIEFDIWEKGSLGTWSVCVYSWLFPFLKSCVNTALQRCLYMKVTVQPVKIIQRVVSISIKHCYLTELFYSFQQRIDCNTASIPDLEFSSEFTLRVRTSTKCTVR